MPERGAVGDELVVEPLRLAAAPRRSSAASRSRRPRRRPSPSWPGAGRATTTPRPSAYGVAQPLLVDGPGPGDEVVDRPRGQPEGLAPVAQVGAHRRRGSAPRAPSSTRSGRTRREVRPQPLHAAAVPRRCSRSATRSNSARARSSGSSRTSRQPATKPVATACSAAADADRGRRPALRRSRPAVEARRRPAAVRLAPDRRGSAAPR